MDDERKKELGDRLRDSLADIRKKSRELDDALAESRKERAMQEGAARDAQNGDEACRISAELGLALRRRQESKVQELVAQRAGLFDEARKNVEKHTVKWITEHGTPEDKTLLMIAHLEEGKGELKKVRLTKAEFKAMQDKANANISELLLINWYTGLYNCFVRFGSGLKEEYKAYRSELALLAQLIDMWDMHDSMAAALTTIHRAAAGKDPDLNLKEIEEQACAKLNSPTVCYVFDFDADTIMADVMKEGGLYSKIQKQANKFGQVMQRVKSFLITAEQWLGERNLLSLLPWQYKHNERFFTSEIPLLSMVDARYRLSVLNAREAAGETITAEDELRAVIPDFRFVSVPTEMIEERMREINELRKRR